MSPASPAATRPRASSAPALDSPRDTSLCSAVLSALRRRDQRRKGAMYVHGLLNVPGRKTMRNLAAHSGEHAAEQSLHHFISASTWDWVGLRARLARRLEEDLGPRAWVVRPMTIPKAGTRSVGVERRYVPHLGRTVNCQHSWGLWCAAEHGSAPVNWQLSLGPEWLADDVLRRSVAIPDRLRADSPEPLAAGIAVQATDWGVALRPVVMDAREVTAAPVIRALSAAGLPFLLRIGAGTPLVAPGLAGGRTVATTAAHLAELALRQRRPVEWTDPAAPRTVRTSLVALLPVSWPGHGPAPRPTGSGPGGSAPSRLALVAEWGLNRPGAVTLWVTDMADAGRGTLLRLGRLVDRVAADEDAIADGVGLRDFEGRSYQGWHRHMSLVSLAHAARLLDPDPRRSRRPALGASGAAGARAAAPGPGRGSASPDRAAS